MATVKVRKNVWGNYAFFVGAAKTLDSGEHWVAVEWLSNQIALGNKLSPKSDVTMAEVQEYRDRINK